MIEVSLNLFVASFLNITYGERSGQAINVVSYVVAVILVLVMVVVLLYLIIFPVLYHKRLITYPDKNVRHLIIFVGFKRKKLKCLLYYAFFMLRRMGLAAVLV